MNTYEIIKDLSRQKKISIRQLEMKFGYSNGYLAKWKNNTPNADELVRLADYFEVSVDYLLGRFKEVRTPAEHFSMKDADMTTFERIKLLAKKQGKSLNKVEEELGLSKNVLYRMKDSDNPTKERLETLADYFNVSVDYLLGRTEEPNAAADQPSMAKQVMMRMDTDGATEEELEELESEMERFFAWRLEEIKRERGKN